MEITQTRAQRMRTGQTLAQRINASFRKNKNPVLETVILPQRFLTGPRVFAVWLSQLGTVLIPERLNAQGIMS